MRRFYLFILSVVIIGHVVFAATQVLIWPFVAERLFNLVDLAAVEKIAPVGTSFASYNLSIAIGLGLSFLLAPTPRDKVQLSVLALIVFTALVGYFGTGSIVVLAGRLVPATLALIALSVLWRRGY